MSRSFGDQGENVDHAVDPTFRAPIANLQADKPAYTGVSGLLSLLNARTPEPGKVLASLRPCSVTTLCCVLPKCRYPFKQFVVPHLQIVAG